MCDALCASSNVGNQLTQVDEKNESGRESDAGLYSATLPLLYYSGIRAMSNNPDKKQLELDVNRAIKLLKDLGYKVLKPVVQYEEI